RRRPAPAGAGSPSWAAGRQPGPAGGAAGAQAPAPSQSPTEHPAQKPPPRPQKKSAALPRLPAATASHTTLQQPSPAGPVSHASPGSAAPSPQVVESSVPVTLPEGP